MRDVVGLPNVDVGGGWLIFGLPPVEVAVHPSANERNGAHHFYFMCDDIDVFVEALVAAGTSCDPIDDQGWALLTQFELPGRGKLGAYQPRHERPPSG